MSYKSNYTGRLKKSKTWKKILKAYDSTCLYCGNYFSLLTCDHVQPQSEGGDNSMYNIVPACEDCNSDKKALFIGDYIKIANLDTTAILKRWKLACFRLQKYRVAARKSGIPLKFNKRYSKDFKDIVATRELAQKNLIKQLESTL